MFLASTVRLRPSAVERGYETDSPVRDLPCRSMFLPDRSVQLDTKRPELNSSFSHAYIVLINLPTISQRNKSLTYYTISEGVSTSF
jgi:hypothetical protein